MCLISMVLIIGNSEYFLNPCLYVADDKNLTVLLLYDKCQQIVLIALWIFLQFFFICCVFYVFYH